MIVRYLPPTQKGFCVLMQRRVASLVMPRKRSAAERSAANAVRLIEALEKRDHQLTLAEWGALLLHWQPEEYAEPERGIPEPVAVKSHEALIRFYIWRESNGYDLFHPDDRCQRRPRQIAESEHAADDRETEQ
jgi:hypothetical protein